MREFFEGEKKAATRRGEFKKYLGTEDEGIERETRRACDCV
jgi:hypothetical protein